MPRASARWVAAPAAPLPRRCLRASSARARAAGGQGQGAGGGGYRYRAGGAMPRDPYRVLDVEMDASQAEIKLAFRQLTKRTHPDVNPSENAAETFRRINAAYEIVGDAERRRRFDLGNDWEAMDEGWMPEAETKARARTAAYNPNSQAAAKPPNSRRKREGMDVAVFDEDRRQAGLNRLYRVRFKRVWGVWCKVWMAGLNVGVPVASAYFVVVGLMHEKLPMFR